MFVYFYIQVKSRKATSLDFNDVTSCPTTLDAEHNWVDDGSYVIGISTCLYVYLTTVQSKYYLPLLSVPIITGSGI